MKRSVKSVMLLMAAVCFATQSVFAFQSLFPSQALDWIKELLRTGQAGNDTVIALWVPAQVIRTIAMSSGAADAQVTSLEQTEAFIDSLRPYVVLAVADFRKISPGARPAEISIHESIRLKDREGTLYEPLDERRLPPMLKLLISSFEVGLSQAKAAPNIGAEIVVFSGKNKKGIDFADPLKNGTFSVELQGAELDWQLPISSLLPLKTCPVDGARLNGAFAYCPFHGVELK